MLLRPLALARAPVELAEAEGAMGDKGAHGELAGEGKRLSIVGVGVLDARGRRDVADEAEGVSLASSRSEPARQRQRLLGVAAGLVDPPGREAGHPREQKNGRRPGVILATAELLDGARDQRERLVSTAGEGIGGAEGWRDG